MCTPKAPKVTNTTVAAPPVIERQAAQAPSQAAILINSTERARRRQGYAALVYTPRQGLPPAATSAKTLLGG